MWSTKAGIQFARPIVGRGAAYADVDLDGDVDLAIATNGGPVYLFRNDGGNRSNSIRLVLEGGKSNRSGIGAEVEVKLGGEVLRRTVRSGSSYCSQSELPLTIGLGSHTTADSITIKWPSGAKSELLSVMYGEVVTVREGIENASTQPFRTSK